MGVDLRVRPGVLRELRRRSRGMVFVVGEPGSGRSATLAAFADELRRDDEPPVVVTYRFTGESAAEMGAALRKQLVADSALLAGRHLDEPGDLLAMLRLATRAAPVVCLFDDFSRADLVWWRLFLRDGEAELARMPLLIVAALDPGCGTVSHEDLAGSSWFASTVRVDPADAAELAAQAGGRIAEPLRSDVFALVGGGAGRVGALWRELLADGAIEFDQDEWRWRWGGPVDHRGYVRDVFDRRIRECCPTPEERERAWAVVRMAAIEGPEFTPVAVAGALHRIGVADDVDAVVDFIDEVLSGPGLIEVDETAWCWRDRFAYRAHFSHPGQAEALRRFGLDDEERKRWAAALARALEDLYAGAGDRIGPVLAAVWTQAGEPGHATSRILLTERRRRGLLRDEAAGPLDHLIHVDHLLRPVSDPLQAVDRSRAAVSEAERSGSGNAVALALTAVADSLRALGRFAEALPYAARAAAVAGAHLDTRWNAQVSLASCHLAIAEDGDLAAAARISADLLHAADSDHRRRTAHALLAHVRGAELFGAGALAEARAAILTAPDPAALPLLRAIADRRGETAIADELSHLMLVLAWDEPQRRARAERDAEVARLAAATDDLGRCLRELHGQA